MSAQQLPAEHSHEEQHSPNLLPVLHRAVQRVQRFSAQPVERPWAYKGFTVSHTYLNLVEIEKFLQHNAGMITIWSDRGRASFHKSVYELPELCLLLSEAEARTAHLLTYGILLERTAKKVKADEEQEMFCSVFIFFLKLNCS